jgi:hypothetical protein
MKSSCYFVFNHSVLLCSNLYSVFTIHYGHAPFSSLYPLQLNSPGLFINPRYNRSSLYRPRTDNIENTVLLLLSADHTENKSRDRYLASSLARWLLPSNIRPIIACVYCGVFIEPLSDNALRPHNINFNIILSSTPRLPKCTIFFRASELKRVYISYLSREFYTPCSSPRPRSDHPNVVKSANYYGIKGSRIWITSTLIYLPSWNYCMCIFNLTCTIFRYLSI